MDVALDVNFKEIQRQYIDFLDDRENGSQVYSRVNQMIEKNNSRLIVDVNILRERNIERCQRLLSNAQEELLILQKALKEVVLMIDNEYATKVNDFFIGFEGSFGGRHVSPRSLRSPYIGNIVCCEGIVTKCNLIKSKVVKSTHYCPKTNKIMEQKYSDLTSLEATPTTTVYPTKDADGNLLETEYGHSIFKDYQTFTIQEMPEKAPAGQLPRSVDVVVENDLVDLCKPGDRVQIIGMYRCLPSKKSNFIAGSFRTVIIANNIELLSRDASPNFSPSDITKIKQFSKTRKNVFSLLANSLAPSISGLECIKKAILCQLVGGTEKILENGTRLRGDINILMVGDPSTAKSQLLRYVLHASPRAIPTTGRGTTGVGLTAAVTTDPETGDRRLEAGAMVLADKGIVCIDEFDKMSDIDRTAIHEVMEQGRVTISKAGIHSSLNARCSVLAAANPVYGRYDEYKTPMENIGMQDSLLSRFDLLFIVLDQVNVDLDYIISEHVLKMHHFRSQNEQDGEVMPLGDDVEFLSTKNLETNEQSQHLQIFEKDDAKLYSSSSSKKFVRIDFINKYIHVAKQLKPVLSDAAISTIVDAYIELRKRSSEKSEANGQMAKTMPVTARSFETLIRLATAHAKLRLSKVIEKADAKVAVDLVYFSFFHKVEKRPKKQKKDDSEEHILASDDESEDGNEKSVHDSPSKEKSTEIDETKIAQFKMALIEIFSKDNSQTVELSVLEESLNKNYSNLSISHEETLTFLAKMQDENKIMLVDGTIYLI